MGRGNLGTFTIEGEDKHGDLALLWADHCLFETARAAMDSYINEPPYTNIVLTQWNGTTCAELARRSTFRDICLPNC